MLRQPKRVFRLGLPALLLAAAILPVFAQEVGRFAVVQNQVTSLKPGADQPVLAVPGAGIVLEELESTGEASAAKMTFGEGAVISLGQNTRFKVTRKAVDEATGASISTIDLLLGKLRVFVSRFWGGRPEVRVNTPTGVVGVKGSEVVVEVFEDGRTRVTVITGSATVTRRGLPGVRRDLGPAQQVLVPPGSGELGSVLDVVPDDLDSLRDATEPDPQADHQLPEKRPVEPIPVSTSVAERRPSGLAIYESATSSRGTLLTDPSSQVLPPPLGPPRVNMILPGTRSAPSGGDR